MSVKSKYYVVWAGQEPGVYDSWDECQLQVQNFPGAKFKAFKTKEEAVAAYRGNPSDHLGLMRAILQKAPHFGEKLPEGIRDYTTIPEIRLDAIACDGACSGNPGKMEYRAVRVVDGTEIFRIGDKTPLTGTNNIAEYLAIIHLAATLARNGDFSTPIYTDSKNTLAWLRRGCSKTTLARTPATAPTLDLLARADAWLAANGPIRNPILKWKTEEWGEIPADFGRKH
ncbi:MAG: ribonuclease H family protein [Muribaculaceae bacterium]|nr:ribonuclease H family protein [Muribaculaceae bacterium]